MASSFSTLLDATLRHLEDLRAGGVRWVDVHPKTLAAFRGPAQLGRPVREPAASFPVAAGRDSHPVFPTAAQPAAKPFGHGLVAGSAVSMPASAPPGSVVPSSEVGPGRSGTTGSESFSAPILSATERLVAMQAIRERALVCQKCPHLVRSRTQVVFGVGSLEAELMFVGEAPGAEEDRQGEPFVGPAGQLLTRIIQAMGFSRETVYIGNILKCRPDTPGAKWGNRPPRPEEMETCKPYLLSQIEIIRPRVLVALGGTAVQGLLGLSTTMGAVRGRWHDLRGIPVMPTFHPSYLLRSEDAADKGFSEKRKTWEDMLKVLERLERPITAKMRGYFQKPSTGGPNG